MRSVISVIAALLVNGILLTGCKDAPKNDNGKIKIVTSLPPAAYIAARVAGDKGVVHSVLPHGRSPHDYSPRPADVRDAANADFFFTVGINFEKSIVRALPETVRVVDSTTGIRRRHFDDGKGCCDGHGHDHHHHHHSDALDPHVWLSPENAAVIAANIAAELSEKDPANSKYYKNNLLKLKDELHKIHLYSKEKLAFCAGKEILVYHPAFGYFTDLYGLRQHPLEINGREMRPEQLAGVIAKAKKENIKVVFVQMQFNPRTANELARRINGEALPLDPLAYDLLANFKAMTDAICKGFGGGK